MKFTCLNCSETKELMSTTTVIRDNKIVVKEAVCCGEYMKEEIENRGVPTVVRNERNGR